MKFNVKKIIILGSTGMMGSVISNLLKDDKRFQILCIYKNSKKIKFTNLKKIRKKKLNVNNFYELKKTIQKFNPHYLINCVGLIKQLFNNKNIKDARYLNSTLPLKLSIIAKKINLK